jgi:type IV secretory pathway VirB3-like protein
LAVEFVEKRVFVLLPLDFDLGLPRVVVQEQLRVVVVDVVVELYFLLPHALENPLIVHLAFGHREETVELLEDFLAHNVQNPGSVVGVVLRHVVQLGVVHNQLKISDQSLLLILVVAPLLALLYHLIQTHRRLNYVQVLGEVLVGRVREELALVECLQNVYDLLHYLSSDDLPAKKAVVDLWYGGVLVCKHFGVAILVVPSMAILLRTLHPLI